MEHLHIGSPYLSSYKVRDHVGADAWTLDPKEGINWCRDFVEGRRL